jgi:hypothetical protein
MRKSTQIIAPNLKWIRALCVLRNRRGIQIHVSLTAGQPESQDWRLHSGTRSELIRPCSD